MARFIPNVPSGISPQKISMIRVRVDPVTVLGVTGGAATALMNDDAHVNCPIGVPLFTTTAAMARSRQYAKHGDEALLPVVFNLANYNSGGDDERKLRFVGVSYAAATRKHPVLAAAVGGMVTIPRQGDERLENLVGSKIQWNRSTLPYESPSGPIVATASTARDAALFNAAGVDATVMSAGSYRFTILLR
jgi:hypothetical protein